MLYVAGEIVLWMVLAFALGLVIGWFVWGLRQRKTLPASLTAPRPAPSSDVESVTVRPVAKPAPVAAAAAAIAAELPVTPPAGQPAVPLAPPVGGPVGAEPSPAEPAVMLDEPPVMLDEPAAGLAGATIEPGTVVAAELAAEHTVVPAPEGDAPAPADNAGLAALVADEPPGAEDPATPAHGQPLVEGGEPASAIVDQDPAPTGVAAAPAPDLMAGATAMGKPLAVDDLKVVEGIGPRIEAILQESGIVTWADLADSSPERLRTLLDLAGDQFRIHDPATWPEQAGLAVAGRWDELLVLQATLTGGKHS